MLTIQQVTKILDIISLLSDRTKIDELLYSIIDNATKVIDVSASSLLLFDENKENLYFYIATGEKGEVIKKQKYELKIGQGIAGWVAKYGKPLIVNNVESDPRFYPNISKEINFKTHNILCAPMMNDTGVVGVIELINKIEGNFTDEDEALLLAFSKQCMLLIDKTQTFTSLEINNELLKSQLNSIKNERNIIGNSHLMKEKLKLAELVAVSDSTVLLQGESGTGKELFAELIHSLSKRKQLPFIKVNCAAIPDTLLESELFGYKKGSFTGATKDTIGKLEMANGGTVFLDEIAEIPLTTQAKLLRFLESREIQILGDATPRTVNVRIIVATNKDLPTEIANKKFREDLYYRLNVFPIYLPPLREKMEDLKTLVDYFLTKYNKELNKHINGLDKDAMDMLNNYHWPGNIRELENIIERACVLCDKEYIQPLHIFLDVSSTSTMNFNEIVALKDAINAFKRAYITNALNKSNWKQIETAKTLDIQRTYLSRLIKELNINKI